MNLPHARRALTPSKPTSRLLTLDEHVANLTVMAYYIFKFEFSNLSRLK